MGSRQRTSKGAARDHLQELQERLGALAFEYRGLTEKGEEHVFVHPTAGTLKAKAKPHDQYAAKQAERQAKRMLAGDQITGRKFVSWLLKQHDVPEDGEIKIRLNLAEEARQFLFNSGERGNPVTLQAFAASRADEVNRLDTKRPALYALRGPLFGVEMSSPREKPVIAAVPEEGKPIQLIHRFDDTLKMYLTRAKVTTVEQLELMTVAELMDIRGMNRTRVRQVWAFFERDDPFDAAALAQEPEPQVPEQPAEESEVVEPFTRSTAKRGVSATQTIKDESAELLEKMKGVFTEGMQAEIDEQKTRAELAVAQLVEMEARARELSASAARLADDVHGAIESLEL